MARLPCRQAGRRGCVRRVQDDIEPQELGQAGLGIGYQKDSVSYAFLAHLFIQRVRIECKQCRAHNP